MTPLFYYRINFSFKNIDVRKKPELINFIFGHATAISSSEIKVFHFFKKLDDRTKIAKSQPFLKILSIFFFKKLNNRPQHHTKVYDKQERA